MENIRSGSLFGYVQCDIEVPETLRKVFANLPPIVMNINVDTVDIGPFLKEYAEKEGLLTQPRRMVISICFLENETIITPLMLFYLDLGLVCRKNYGLVQYTPMKCFNSFVQSAVNAGREGDENSTSNVVAEVMKILANSLYGCHFMGHSRHTETKYLSDEKTNGAIIERMFRHLGYLDDKLYKVGLVKLGIEHKETMIVEVFILLYAKLRMLELYYNLIDKYCDVKILRSWRWIETSSI